MNNYTKWLPLLAFFLSISSCGITEITSSTSSTLDTVTPDVTLNEFVTKRFIAIRTEAAQGQGENLQALAQLMGQKDVRAFSKNIKDNFDLIFADVNAPEQIIARIEAQTNYQG